VQIGSDYQQLRRDWNKMKHFNMIVCGVGGTGVIGLSELIKKAASLEGNRVVSSESRGSAQRGGSTTASVRYTLLEGNETYDDRTSVWSGAVGVGEADLMIATEVAEGIRNAHYLSASSKVILNDFIVMPKQTRKEMKAKSLKYPSLEEVASSLRQITPLVYVVNASEMSVKNFGTYRMTNPILVGICLAHGFLPLRNDTIKGLLKGKDKDALELGLKQKILSSRVSPK
jgi:indolepyruvate ferredoxin oxidoreductase beta subunit